jgi:hypothetical protein
MFIGYGRSMHKLRMNVFGIQSLTLKRQCIQGSPHPALNDIGGSLQNVETRKNSAGPRSCFSVDFVMFS